MNWFYFQTSVESSASPLLPPIAPKNFNISDNHIGPSILLVSVIVAVVFFVSGLLLLLIRVLFLAADRNPDDFDSATALQGQLQQLFRLHDAGIDQSSIDTLPVFRYKDIIGLKNPFDCAVCLCEFEADDKLRLLPKCSHAFHLDCIDTWLLSHSTCPLCRSSLLPESSLASSGSCSPIVLVIESGDESLRREVGWDGETVRGISNLNNTQLSAVEEDVKKASCDDILEKTGEFGDGKIMAVKLGKFRNVDLGIVGGECSSISNCNLEERRCFSMGSFEYVVDESSVLQVAIKPPPRKQACKKRSLPLMPGHQLAMSECDCNSSRNVFKGFDLAKSGEIDEESDTNAAAADIKRGKGESSSFSKIWLQSKKNKPSVEGSSRRTVSFRLPLQQTLPVDELKSKRIGVRRTVSEIEADRWGGCRGELEVKCEEESCNSLESQRNPPFARRTLLWLLGRQNKVAYSSSTVTAP